MERGLPELLGLVDEDVRDPQVPGQPGVQRDVVLAVREVGEVLELQPRVDPVHAHRDLHGHDLGYLVHLKMKAI